MEIENVEGNEAPLKDSESHTGTPKAEQDDGETGEQTTEVIGQEVERHGDIEDTIQGEHESIEGENNERVMGEGEGVMGEEEEVVGEGEEVAGEEEANMDGEMMGEEKVEEKAEEKEEEVKQDVEAVVEEEEQYVEEPPPDPAAPYDLSDSKEALREPFELRPDQEAEVEQLWDFFQNYTPAYTDIKDYITEKELVYMLKALMLMTYTPEQLQELIAYVVRPSHPLGHINYEQFLRIVYMRQRDFSAEDELRSALQVMDPDRTGSVDREYLKDVLLKLGHKMPQKQLDNLIKEVDLSNDGTIGIEDVVGTMGIDLNKEDLILLRQSLQPPDENAEATEDNA
ncbi:uncharacterized protein LOC126970657 [Leptidea sinapis]|uniref:uncharacterized protein LOC126970657 n=1 Tax=Leptidea sinapis TaxID=189913 RepID=UPI0021C2EB63|nr:uncharacterized protein LOC126970657 [Leptidea sinapis]